MFFCNNQKLLKTEQSYYMSCENISPPCPHSRCKVTSISVQFSQFLLLVAMVQFLCPPVPESVRLFQCLCINYACQCYLENTGIRKTGWDVVNAFPTVIRSIENTTVHNVCCFLVAEHPSNLQSMSQGHI